MPETNRSFLTNRIAFPTGPVEQGWYAELIGQLVERRCLLKHSQRSLADRLGVELQQLSRYERLTHMPSPFLLMCWCQVLGLQLTTVAAPPEPQASWLQPLPDPSDARRAWA